MNTITRTKPIPSPIQAMRMQSFDVRSEGNPAREMIKKCTGTYNLTAVVEEDTQTVAIMKQVPGLISFLCTLRRDNRVVSQGRGSAVLSPSNKYIGRAVSTAFNAAVADAAIRSTKVLDTFRDTENASNAVALGEAYQANATDGFEPATEKQVEYLRQLIRINVEDDEREGMEAQLGELTKQEASKMIESFRR